MHKAFTTRLFLSVVYINNKDKNRKNTIQGQLTYPLHTYEITYDNEII